VGASTVTRVVTALCLCLAAAFVSGLLLLQHHGDPGAVSAVSQVCGGEKSSCEEVARSSWSAVRGIPLAAFGLAFYLALALALALALLGQAEPRQALSALALVLLGAGLVVDLFLLGVQAFAIHAYCALCILTYVLGLCALLLLLPARQWLRRPGGTFGRADGRLALGAWLLGALLAAAAVLAGEVALGAREAQRQATLLGPAPTTTTATAPAPAPVPSATAPLPTPGGPSPRALAATAPAASQDARYWQQRAQQLQETLDDPRKLETYFSDKAQREYETTPPVAIDTTDVPARGPANAPVKVVEYSDFLCPFCRSLAGALSQFVPQAGGRVVVYFKNYPLDAACNPKLKQSTHPGSCELALGGVCAQRQGKFEAYHDKVFSTDLHNPQRADVVRLAGQVGLDPQAMQGCLDDPRTRDTLAAQVAEANQLGVAATPTVYVNGKKLPRLNDFVAVVDKEARKKGFLPLQPQ